MYSTGSAWPVRPAISLLVQWVDPCSVTNAPEGILCNALCPSAAGLRGTEHTFLLFVHRNKPFGGVFNLLRVSWQLPDCFLLFWHREFARLLEVLIKFLSIWAFSFFYSTGQTHVSSSGFSRFQSLFRSHCLRLFYRSLFVFPNNDSLVVPWKFLL